MEDQEIIKLYWDRSEQAIAESDRKYGRFLGKIAWNILFSREDTEECINDTWMHAWNAMPPHRPSPLRSFLGKITRNLALNLYERNHAEKRGGGETALGLDELAECVAGRDAVSGTAERLVLAKTLEIYLAGLKPEQRRVFVRRYWYMSPVKEIASDFGMSESNVKMTLLRARKELREMLEKEGISV